MDPSPLPSFIRGSMVDILFCASLSLIHLVLMMKHVATLIFLSHRSTSSCGANGRHGLGWSDWLPPPPLTSSSCTTFRPSWTTPLSWWTPWPGMTWPTRSCWRCTRSGWTSGGISATSSSPSAPCSTPAPGWGHCAVYSPPSSASSWSGRKTSALIRSIRLWGWFDFISSFRALHCNSSAPPPTPFFPLRQQFSLHCLLLLLALALVLCVHFSLRSGQQRLTVSHCDETYCLFSLFFSVLTQFATMRGYEMYKCLQASHFSKAILNARTNFRCYHWRHVHLHETKIFF